MKVDAKVLNYGRNQIEVVSGADANFMVKIAVFHLVQRETEDRA